VCQLVLKDNYGRPLVELRVSVTQMCNYSCIFCHREGISGNHVEISLDKWEKIFKAAKNLGIRKMKITGGEPLLYRQIVEFVRTAKKYFDEVSLTTNGYLLEEFSQKLKSAGIDRINVSLHSLDRETYKKITGVDGLKKVLRGIKAARDLGIKVKVNVLVLRGINDREVERFIEFARVNMVDLQFIEYEPLLGLSSEYHISLDFIDGILEKRAIVIKIKRRHYKRSYLIPPWIDVLHTWHSRETCMGCTRLRITPDGKAYPCIFRGNETVDLLPDPVNGIIKANNLRRPFWR